VFVGGVRMDEYGEFIDPDEDDEPAHVAVADEEPELPLTDERCACSRSRVRLEAEETTAPIVRWQFRIPDVAARRPPPRN